MTYIYNEPIQIKIVVNFNRKFFILWNFRSSEYQSSLHSRKMKLCWRASLSLKMKASLRFKISKWFQNETLLKRFTKLQNESLLLKSFFELQAWLINEQLAMTGFGIILSWCNNRKVHFLNMRSIFLRWHHIWSWWTETSQNFTKKELRLDWRFI